MSSQDDDSSNRKKKERPQYNETDIDRSYLEASSHINETGGKETAEIVNRIKKRSRVSNNINTGNRDDTSLNHSRSLIQDRKQSASEKSRESEERRLPTSPHDPEIGILTQQNVAGKPTSTNSEELDVKGPYSNIGHGFNEYFLPIATKKRSRKVENNESVIHAAAINKFPRDDSNEEDSSTLASRKDQSILEPPINSFTNLPPSLPIYTQILQANSTFPMINFPNAIGASATTGTSFTRMSSTQGMSRDQQLIMSTILNQQQLQINQLNMNQSAAFTFSQHQLQNTGTAIQPRSDAVRMGTSCKQGPLLYISTDDEVLSDFQILVRKQIEFFEVSIDDVGKTTSGRRRPIMLHQVGIRCCHCRMVPSESKQNGAVYFPAKLSGIYQAAQNMAVTHLINNCTHINKNIKNQFQAYQQQGSRTGHGGKQYWAEAARAQGIEESSDGYLQFSSTCNRSSINTR